MGREGRERWALRGESGGQGGHFCPPPQLKNICPESEEGTKSFFIQNINPTAVSIMCDKAYYYMAFQNSLF